MTLRLQEETPQQSERYPKTGQRKHKFSSRWSHAHKEDGV